jgi:hypothetical protein
MFVSAPTILRFPSALNFQAAQIPGSGCQIKAAAKDN